MASVVCFLHPAITTTRRASATQAGARFIAAII
jgi:hypothetical protein